MQAEKSRCFLVSKIKFFPFPRCRYCVTSFHSCFMMQSSAIVIFSIILFVVSVNVSFSFIQRLSTIGAIVVLIFFLILINKRTDEMKHSEYSLNKTNERLKDEINTRFCIQQELSENQKRLITIWDTVKAGIVIIDAQSHKIVDANPLALSMLSTTKEKVLGATCHHFICPTEKGKCPITDLGNTMDNSERVLISQNGRHIPILKTAVTAEINGKPHLLESFTDISSLKKVQSELLAAKIHAESANQAKSQFLANMSHEFRTPLHHVIGFTELLLEKSYGELNDNQTEYLTNVHGSSNHLLSLINDILDISKVEAGKLELSPSCVNLKELLENSFKMIKEKAMKHGIKLSNNMNGTPDTITADERKLKQIMYNLLSNAVKFTPDGGEVSVTARTCGLDDVQLSTADSDPNGGIKISISDTGIGLNSEHIDRIFNPFEQVESTKSRKFQGTGLGLSLTKNFVELHGGEIWAESEGEGQGSTFSFLLPVTPKNIPSDSETEN